MTLSRTVLFEKTSKPKMAMLISLAVLINTNEYLKEARAFWYYKKKHDDLIRGQIFMVNDFSEEDFNKLFNHFKGYNFSYFYKIESGRHKGSIIFKKHCKIIKQHNVS
jgi:hypothetical protein